MKPGPKKQYDARLEALVTRHERERIQVVAKSAGITVSEFIRSLVLTSVEQTETEAGDAA